MSSPGLDASEKIQYLQESMGIDDPQECANILEAHNWEVDAAVATVLAIGDREANGSIPSAQPGPVLRSRNGASTSGSHWPGSFSDTISSPEDMHENPGRIAARSPTALVWRLATAPFWILKGSFFLMAKAAGVGLWAAGGVFSQTLQTLNMLARRAAGGTGAPTRLALTGSEAGHFKQRFEAEYGPHHPDFVDLTFVQAVRRAGQEHKFLFVYLHSSQHTNTPPFCSGTLCTDSVIQYLDENFLTWGGDVRSSEGYQLSNSLKASTFPFCAVVTGTGSSTSRVALLLQIEGPRSSEVLIRSLQRILEEQGAMLVAARAEEEERLLSRRLREEQDAAYQAALLADQERERKRQEEAEQRRVMEEAAAKKIQEEQEAQLLAEKQAAAQEAAMQRRREEKAAALGPEPAKAVDVTQVRISLPSGERKERRFHSTAKVQNLYDYVDSLGDMTFGKYQLVSNFPRTVYGPSTMEQTLVEAGLHPHASLFVQGES